MLRSKRGQSKQPRNHEERKKFIETKIKAVAKAVGLGMTYDSAARAAGINPSTFYTWKSNAKKDPKGVYGQCWQILEQAEAKGEQALLARIDKAGREGDWRADAWILERRKPERWAKQQQLTQTFIDKTDKDITKMSDEELDAYIAEQQKAMEAEDES